jgi:hypothetical protein
VAAEIEQGELFQLEMRYPGISDVFRDPRGYIVLE